MGRRVWIKPVSLAVCAAAFLGVAIQHASDGGTERAEGLMYEAALYGVPFAVFVFAVWSAGSRPRMGNSHFGLLRRRLILAAEVLTIVSASLFLLTLPLTGIIAEHEAFGGTWILSGMIAAALGAVFSVTGSPRRWLHAVSCALLVPCWIVAAGLFAKMAMD